MTDDELIQKTIDLIESRNYFEAAVCFRALQFRYGKPDFHPDPKLAEPFRRAVEAANKELAKRKSKRVGPHKSRAALRIVRSHVK